MAIYRQIHISFWQDEFILNLTPEEKFFYLYLMTNSKTTQCGIYELPRKIIEFETGYNSETIEKLLQRFIKYGKILYSDETKEIILVNWMKHNANSSPKVINRIEKELKNVKNKDFKDLFYRVCIQYGYSMDMRTQEEPEPEQEEEQKPDPKEKKDHEQFFEELWQIYPRKKGKGQVSLTQKKTLHKIGDELKRGLERFKKDMERENRPMDKYPYGSTFFNSGYIDYLDENYNSKDPPEKPYHKRYDHEETIRREQELSKKLTEGVS